MAHHYKTQQEKGFAFDAVVDRWPTPLQDTIEGILAIKGRKISVSVFRYERKGGDDQPDQHFVRMRTSQSLPLCWDDSFKVLDRKNRAVVFQGRVLDPFAGGPKRKGAKQRLELLRALSGDAKEMVLAKARASSGKGLTEKELIEFSSLPRATLLKIGRQLEEEGKIRILSFSPLSLLSQESFDFLCSRILSYLSQFHEKHPEDFGVSPVKIQRRYGLPRMVLALVLKHLHRTGQISQDKNLVTLGDFSPLPSPEEEALLRDMEELYTEGSLRLVSLAEMQQRFGLSKKKLDRMLSFLVERRKIVLGKDGFFLHSSWLDDVIHKVSSSKKKELSVSDFKQMTGLSRKYAIPLLELLDEMGVTRRRGPTREILRGRDQDS
jgi:selenocysteine-specific elongation factor